MHEDKLYSVKEKLASLSPLEKELLLAKIKQKKASQELIEHAEQDFLDHALTNAQKRLWVLEKFDRVPYLYHVPFALCLSQPIDTARLQVALDKVFEKHRQLRGFFKESNEYVSQCYAGTAPIIKKIQLAQDLGDNLQLTAEHALSDFYLQPFNLKQAHLFRIALARSPNNQYILLCCHHLIMDAWSAEILLDELANFYNNEHLLPIPSYDYALYHGWEKQQLTAISQYTEQLFYWEDKIKYQEWEIELPYDHARPLHLSGRGDVELAYLPEDSYHQVLTYAKQHQVSINHLILSVFQLVLANFSGKTELVLGMPVAGRQQSRWQKTIGLFVNTCLHTSAIDYDISFEQYVHLVKEQVAQSMAHSSLPYDYLLQHFYQKKICEQGASFNVLYNFIQAEKSSNILFGESIVKTLNCLMPISKFDFTLHTVVESNRLLFMGEYSTDLFLKETITYLMNYFLSYLVTAINNDKLTISQLGWHLNN